MADMAIVVLVLALLVIGFVGVAVAISGHFDEGED